MSLHPALVLFASALLVSISGRGIRRIVLAAGTGLAIVAWGSLDVTSRWSVSVGGYALSLLHVDRLSLVFGLVFVMIAAIGTFYALHNEQRAEHVATLVYAGSSLGVVFAGDWITLFVFWELMAVSSLFVIWFGETPASTRAGYRYLLVHVAGGSLLFGGILVHLYRGGGFSVRSLMSSATDPTAFWLVLIGVGVNAAIPPLHAWLTDAYPEGSVTGSVFLSAFTTKTAVYVLLRVFPGTELLVWMGVMMTLYGVVYAIMENEIRRLLSYHIVSQVGYMVAGVGMGTELALDGATAHAYNHILYKALLFMGAGAVIYATGLRKLTELGGLGGRMKLVLLFYTVASFSISGVPLFNGFISKAMVVSAAAESHRPVAELLLTLAGIGTFLSVGLKLPYFAFFGERKDIGVRRLPWNMLVAMGVGSILCTAYGVFPDLIYGMLPYRSSYHPYSLDHVLSSVQLLLGTAVGFWLLLDRLKGKAVINLDTDWFYRRPIAELTQGLVDMGRIVGQASQRFGSTVASSLSRTARDPWVELGVESEASTKARDPYRFRFPIGFTVFWVTVYFVLLALITLVGSVR